MATRTWTVMLAAALLTAGAVAIAGSVQGQDYERTAVVDETGAHELEWESHEPGNLRLALDADDNATSPQATVTLLGGDGERVGTYTLDEEWPRLDHRVQPDETARIIVHRLVDAELTALHEEGHPVDWQDLALDERTVPLAEADGEPVTTQVAVDLDETPLHADLSLEGSVEELDLEATNGEDETALEATVPSADTAEGQALAPSVHPSALDADSLLVKLDARTLDGALSLSLYTIAEESAHVVEDEGPEEEPSTREENATSQENATSEENATTEEPESNETDPGTELQEVTLTPDTPVAVTVEDASAALAVQGEEGTVVAFAPNDTVAGTATLEEHHRHDDEDDRDDEDEDGEGTAGNASSVELPVETTGEYVLVLADADENATLEAPEPSLADTRELERETVNGTITPDGELSVRDHGNATAAIEGGLLAFSWESEDLDAERTVRLEDPDGETVYEAHSSAGLVTLSGCPEDPMVGPAGDYTVTTESTSLGDEGMAFELVTYVR